MKEQNKSSEKELNKVKINNLPDTEFKTQVNKMLKELTNYFTNIKKRPRK